MSFVKSVVHTFVTQYFVMFIGVIISVINARILGPDKLGILVLLLLIPRMVFRYINLGLGSGLSYFASKNKITDQEILSLLWKSIIILSIISALIFIFIWKFPFSPWKDIDSVFIYVMMITIPLFISKNFIQRFLSGKLEIIKSNISNLIRRISYIILIVAFVLFLEMGILGAAISFILSHIFCLLYLIYNVLKFNKKKYESISSFAIFKIIFRYSKWNYIHMFLNFFIEEIPTFFIKTILMGNNLIGWFSRSNGISKKLRNITTPVSKVLFPYTANKSSLIRTNFLCRTIFVMMIIMVSIFIVLIKPIVIILYGKDYLPAVKLFYGLAPGLIFWPMNKFISVHLAASGRPKLVVISSASTLTVGSVLCWYLVKNFGTMGGAVSGSLIFIINAVILIYIYTNLTETKIKDLFLLNKKDFIFLRDRLIAKIKGEN